MENIFFPSKTRKFTISCSELILKNVQHFLIFDFCWNFFWKSPAMLLVAPTFSVFTWKIIFFSKTWHLWFSQFNYSTVSILSTNKLVYILSTCTLSVMFVRNHCCTTILMYSHFLVPPWVPDPINQSTFNQSIFQKKILVSYFSSPSFIGFMYTFYSRIQSFHALTPAGATVVHKSNSFNPEPKCRLCRPCRLRILLGCIRPR